MRGYGWWYAFGLRFQVAVRWNNWALPIGVNWGTEYCYPGLDKKIPEYRWVGIDIGPLAFSVFKDHDLDRDEPATCPKCHTTHRFGVPDYCKNPDARPLRRNRGG